MPDVLRLDAKGKLTLCHHFYTHWVKLIPNGIFTLIDVFTRVVPNPTDQ